MAHAVAGYRHYQANHGDHLAAAITYFSFLALFPLILLGVSVVGFVLASHPSLQTELYNSIYRDVPGSFGTTLKDTVDSAIRNRTSVGIIGLVGVLLAGLGWIANLRTAIDTVWGLPTAKRNFIAAKLADGLVLVGLGLGVVVSVGLTAGGTAAGGAILRATNLQSVPGAGVITAALGIVLGVLGSTVVFGWLLIRLPQIQVSRRTAVRTTMLAAVGFEVLKIVGTYYIARVIKSPAAATIGPIIGVLIWIDLVSRFMLYTVAWAATAEPAPEPEPQLDEALLAARRTDGLARPEPSPSFSPIGLAAGLLSTGAALGAAAVAAGQRRRRRTAREPS